MRKLTINVAERDSGVFTAQVVFDSEQVYESTDKNFNLAYLAATQYVTAPDSVIPWSK